MESLNYEIMESFWGSKLSYMVACCGTAAITGTVSWLAMGDSSPLNTQKEMIVVSDTLMYSPVMQMDTTFFDVSTDLPESINTGHAQFLPIISDSPPAPLVEETAPPVVIKKQIIRHETVVVRDTIFIIE